MEFNSSTIGAVQYFSDHNAMQLKSEKNVLPSLGQ